MGATKRRRDYEELRDVSAGCEGPEASVWDEWKKGIMK